MEALAHGQTERDGGVEVAAGDVTDGVGHREDGQTESERDADEADAQTAVLAVDEVLGREDRGATATEDEPEGAEGLGTEAVDQ